MSYILEITILGVIITVFVIIALMMKAKNKRDEEDASKKVLAQKEKIAKRVKSVSSNDLITGQNQAVGGIIAKKIIHSNSPPKDKIAKWVDTDSYEDDVNNNNNDILVNNEKEDDMKKILIKSLVLLVDDSLVVRKYVGDLLRGHNYDLVIKNDGWEAITYLNGNSQKPDLIITDIQMPNMDGFQLIEAIRKERKFRSVPIIVISAHVEAHDHLILMEEENIQGFIRKPFEDNDLVSQAKYLLNNY